MIPKPTAENITVQKMTFLMLRFFSPFSVTMTNPGLVNISMTNAISGTRTPTQTNVGTHHTFDRLHGSSPIESVIAFSSWLILSLVLIGKNPGHKTKCDGI